MRPASKHRFAGTPMLRARRRGLRRNVCVALGNIGDERALPALKRLRRTPSLWSRSTRVGQASRSRGELGAQADTSWPVEAM